MANWIYNPIEIKFAILAHFTTLYTSKALYTPIIIPNPWNLHPITSHIQDSISGDVTNGEVKDALFSFKPTKVPSPDSFNPIFFQRHWDIVEPSFINSIKEVFMTRKIPEDWNLTFICLVPKVDKPETIHQFQSISFYNTLYKIVTKILVQRLKPPLDDLIHPLQASFVLGRKVRDNIILAQEVIHSMATSKSKKGLMAIKINIKKAFDRMD